MNLEELFEYEFKGRPMIRKDIMQATSKLYRAYADGLNSWSGITIKLLNELEDLLLRRGWKMVGGGAFSDTWLHPKGELILKINRRSDPAYDRFIDVIQKYPNPHFPKIMDAKQIIGGRWPYGIYLIEKLEKLSMDKKYIFSQALHNIAIHPDMTRNQLSEQTNDTYTDYENLKFQECMKTMPDSLMEAMRIIGRNCPVKSYFDLHPGNIMQREDGTIVIIDPYA